MCPERRPPRSNSSADKAGDSTVSRISVSRAARVLTSGARCSAAPSTAAYGLVRRISHAVSTARLPRSEPPRPPAIPQRAVRRPVPRDSDAPCGRCPPGAARAGPCRRRPPAGAHAHPPSARGRRRRSRGPARLARVPAARQPGRAADRWARPPVGPKLPRGPCPLRSAVARARSLCGFGCRLVLASSFDGAGGDEPGELLVGPVASPYGRRSPAGAPAGSRSSSVGASCCLCSSVSRYSLGCRSS